MNDAAERAHGIGAEVMHGDGERNDHAQGEGEKGFSCNHVAHDIERRLNNP